jgi:hypothetical protein
MVNLCCCHVVFGDHGAVCRLHDHVGRTEDHVVVSAVHLGALRGVRRIWRTPRHPIS